MAVRRVPSEERHGDVRVLRGLRDQLPVLRVQGGRVAVPFARHLAVHGGGQLRIHVQLPRLRRGHIPQVDRPVGAAVVRVHRGRRVGVRLVGVQPVRVQRHHGVHQERGRHVQHVPAKHLQSVRDGVRGDVRQLLQRVLRRRGDRHVLLHLLHHTVRRARRSHVVLDDVSTGNHLRRDRIARARRRKPAG